MVTPRFPVVSIALAVGGVLAVGTAAAQETVEPRFVLGAAHVPGVNDTEWRTSLEVCNFGAASRNVQLDFLARGQANPTPQTVTFLLRWGQCARFADVVSSLFGLEQAAGAIRVGCDGDGCLALARTANDTAEGTYGAGQPALAMEAAATAGESAALIHLSESADAAAGYRTNLELLNPTAAPLTVEVALFGSNGVQLGTLSLDLLPYEVEQVTRVFRQVTTAAVADGYALLHSMTPDGAFFAAASLVDNRSGDVTTIAATVVSSLLPPLETITPENAGHVRLLKTLRIPEFGTTPVSQCSVDFSPDGTLLSGVCSRSRAPLWDVASGQVLLSLLPSPEHVVATAFSPGGEVLATGELGGRVALWDPTSGELTREVDATPAAVWELAFSPQGDTLALATANYFSSPDPAAWPGVHLWDLARGEALWSYPGDGQMIGLAVGYAPDGETIAFGTAVHGVILLDAATGHPVRSFPVAAPVADVAFSPDGELLAAASDDTTIRLWRTSDDQLLRTLEGHTHYVNGIAFSPDGRLLASGSHDRTVAVWDVRSGERLALLEGHERPVLRVAVDPAGTLIASISWDGTVRLWGVAAEG